MTKIETAKARIEEVTCASGWRSRTEADFLAAFKGWCKGASTNQIVAAVAAAKRALKIYPGEEGFALAVLRLEIKRQIEGVK